MAFNKTVGAPWTEEEVEYLTQNYRVKTKQELIQALEKHSWQGITCKASKLGLKKKEWTDKDIQFLVEHPNMSCVATARMLGRTVGSVQHKRFMLGIAVDIPEGMITQKDASEIFGVSNAVIRRWEKQGLKADRTGGSIVLYNEKTLLRVARTRKTDWDATKADKGYLGVYEWFREKLRIDKEVKRLKRLQMEI